MVGNEIDTFINSTGGGSRGAALTILLMGFVAVLMMYYIVSVNRATREAQA
jgi:ABC-type spermidine/putrescine transport system permease subunit I